MTLQHMSVRGNNHTGFDRFLSLQMALNTADNLYIYSHIMSGHLSEIASYGVFPNRRGSDTLASLTSDPVTKVGIPVTRNSSVSDTLVLMV